MQEIRSWRTRVVKPGRPSEEYLLRKLLLLRALRRANARHARLARRHPPLPVLDPPPPRRLRPADHQGRAAGGAARRLAATTSSPTRAARIRPRVVCAEAQRDAPTTRGRRRELIGQLNRLRDLYVIGDLSKNEYVLRRQAHRGGAQRTGPPLDPRIDRPKRSSATSPDFWEPRNRGRQRRGWSPRSSSASRRTRPHRRGEPT